MGIDCTNIIKSRIWPIVGEATYLSSNQSSKCFVIWVFQFRCVGSCPILEIFSEQRPQVQACALHVLICQPLYQKQGPITAPVPSLLSCPGRGELRSRGKGKWVVEHPPAQSILKTSSFCTNYCPYECSVLGESGAVPQLRRKGTETLSTVWRTAALEALSASEA